MKHAIKTFPLRNSRAHDRLLFTMLQQHSTVLVRQRCESLSLRPTTAKAYIKSVAAGVIVQIQTPGELNLLSALVIMMKLSK